MTWVKSKLLYQENFIKPVVGLIDFYDIGTQVKFEL